MSDYWARLFLIGCIVSWDKNPTWRGYIDPPAIEATFRLWKWLHSSHNSFFGQ